MQESYPDPYLNLIFEMTGVLSSRKLLLYSIKTNRTKCFFNIRSSFCAFWYLYAGIFKVLNCTYDIIVLINTIALMLTVLPE